MTYKTYNIELIMSDTARSHWMSLLAQTRDAFNICAHTSSRRMTYVFNSYPYTKRATTRYENNSPTSLRKG